MISTAGLVDRYEGSGQGCALQFRSFGGRYGFEGEIVTIDVIAGIGAVNGCQGATANGAVRDVAALRDLYIGGLEVGSNPYKFAKFGTGTREETLRFGGVTFRPGWWLVADEEGVLVWMIRSPSGDEADES